MGLYSGRGIGLIGLACVVVLVISISATATGFTCPVYFEAWGRKCYYFQGAHQSMSNAEYTCRNLRAMPVLVESQDEVNYLVGKRNGFDRNSHAGYWMRCKDEAVEGQWTCDNSANYWNSDTDNHGIWDWNTIGTNEPDGGSTENCLILKFDGKYSDVPCVLLLSFNVAVCEITMVKATAAPTPLVTTSPARASTTAGKDPDFTCPTFFEAWGHKCYYFQGAHQSMSNAEHTCRNLRAMPVLVESHDEVDYLVGKSNDYDRTTHEGYWLRCTDEEMEGQWTCDNSTYYWNSDTDNHGIWDWNTIGTNEPDGGSTENCLILKFDGKYSDVPCVLLLSFNVAVCEITMVTATAAPTALVTTPSTRASITARKDPDFTCPVYFEAWGRKCYYFQGAHQTMSNAEHTCRNLGAMPVLVESHDEVNYLVGKRNGFDRNSHAGYWMRCKDETVEGQWTCDNSANYWNSDTDSHGFWDWNTSGTNEPDGGSTENCLILTFDGKYSDVPCVLLLSFNVAVCEITMVTATAAPTMPTPPVTTSSTPASTTAVPCSTPETPSVWLGEAPYCETKDTHCSHFGLDFVCNDIKGDDGQECLNGTKVLCSYPDPEPLSPPTPITTLKVLAYNVWELRYLWAQSGQRERTCQIPSVLFASHPDLDVIVFNEVFMGGCFVNDSLTLRDIIHEHGFIYSTSTVGEPVSMTKPENGGVFIASRWPIKYEEKFMYNNAERGTADFFSGKGAMYAQIEKTVETESMIYHIFGTHLQAQNGTSIDEVRVAQAGEMHAFKRKQEIPANEPVIYAGDLNADKINNPQNAADVLMALEAIQPQIIGELQATVDTRINDVFFEVDNEVAWLDYVLYSEDHLPPQHATLEVVRPLAPNHFPVCMAAINPRHTYPDSDLCFMSKSIRDLSDHFAVLGVFDYNWEPEPTTEQQIKSASQIQKSSFPSMVLIFLCLSIWKLGEI